MYLMICKKTLNSFKLVQTFMYIISFKSHLTPMHAKKDISAKLKLMDYEMVLPVQYDIVLYTMLVYARENTL